MLLLLKCHCCNGITVLLPEHVIAKSGAAVLLETLNEAGAGLGSLLIWLLLLPGASPASCTPQSAATCCVTLDDNHCYGLATYYVSRRRGEGVRQMLTIADGRVGGGAKI